MLDQNEFKHQNNGSILSLFDHINQQENDDIYLPILRGAFAFLGKCHLHFDETNDTEGISDKELILKIKDLFNVLTSGNQNILNFIETNNLIIYIFHFFLNPISFIESFELINCIQAILRIPIYKSNHFLFQLWLENFLDYSPEEFCEIDEIDFIEKVINTFRLFDIPNCLTNDFSLFEDPTFLTHLCSFRLIDQCYNPILLFFDYIHSFLPSSEEHLLQITMTLLSEAPYSSYFNCTTLLLHLSLESPDIFNESIVRDIFFKLFEARQYPIQSNLFLSLIHLPSQISNQYINNDVIRTVSDSIISFSHKTDEDEEMKIDESLELSSVKLLNYILSHDDGTFFDIFFIHPEGFTLLPVLLECMDNSLFEFKLYMSETLLHIMNVLLIHNEQFNTLYTNNEFVEYITKYLISALDIDDENTKNSLIDSLFSTLMKLVTQGSGALLITSLQSLGFVDSIFEDSSLDENKVKTLIHTFFES